MICEETFFRKESYIGLNFDSINKNCGAMGSSMWLIIQQDASMQQVTVWQTCLFTFKKESDWRCVNVR
jgi:NADH:ubiquinone oxidoreductase subunit F (NADH-binding)